MTLFDQNGADLDAIYLRLRDTDDGSDAEQKAYLDGLWTRARPLKRRGIRPRSGAVFL
jgi:hypothetical protein